MASETFLTSFSLGFSLIFWFILKLVLFFLGFLWKMNSFESVEPWDPLDLFSSLKLLSCKVKVVCVLFLLSPDFLFLLLLLLSLSSLLLSRFSISYWSKIYLSLVLSTLSV